MERSFRFRHFSIQDNKSTMKVGTDAVLLGAWVQVEQAKTILDIGTGSGVIALMMAQRSASETAIDAIEIDNDSAKQARENVARSPWPGKVNIHNTAVQDFDRKSKYDLIVCNPPFFNNSLLPPSANRQVARHTQTLSFEELIENAIRLLSPDGIFGVVLPYSEGNHFREMAGQYNLTCHRSTAFYSRQNKPQERWLMEFSFEGTRKKRETDVLVLYDEGERWTNQYADLTREFYIK